MPFTKKSFSDVYTSMVADTRRRLPALTDFEEGSVARSLFESFAYEMATLYEQLDLVYQSGFVDTAEGAQLDRVVAVLGLKRNEPDFAAGLVAFERDRGLNDTLVIPIGTLVSTEEDQASDPSKKSYLTVEQGQLAPGATSVDVRVQAEVRGKAQASDAETVVVMPRPVPGVKAVINAKPIRFLGRERETDLELRQRAKQALLASGRASVTSLETALLSVPGVRDVQIREDFVHLGQGIIEIYVDGLTNQNTQLLRERIDQVRAAGVYVILKPAIAISLEAVIQIEVDARIAAEERLSLENRVALAVEGLVEQLGMGQPLRFSQLTNAVLNVSGVLDLHEFQISAFRDTESFAHGSVTLSRSARIDESVTVPARTVFRTRLGQEFLTTTDTQFPEKQRTIQAEVQAANTGRSGELVRTGAAIAWESQKIGGVTVNVRNEAPLLIDRSNYKSTDRRIAVQILERLVPERIRVASEQKPLRVRVLLRLLAPGDDRDKQRLRIEGAINSFFAGLTPGQPLLKSDLEAQLSKLKPAIGAFELRLLAFPFQSQVPEDDYQVDVSFVEQPVAELIFVYSEPLELAGDMRLVLSLTASDDEKRTAVGAARQAITDYLDGLAPENDADLTVIQAVAAKVAKVLRVEFQPTACSVLNASGQPIPNKIRDRAVSVDAFEKVQLSEASFSIQA